MHRRRRRAVGAISGLLAVAGVIAGATSAVGAAPAGKADSGTVYFAPTHQVGSIGWYAGDTTDKIMGPGAVVYQLKVLPTTKPGTLTINIKKVTTYSATGSLVGTATAKLTILDTKGNSKVTNGVLKLTNGFGSQAGHSLVAKISGKGNTNTGQYKLTYTGTYS
jgi:hypothetical protein